MKSREAIAHNYLIFRYPIEYVLVLFPITVGIITNIFVSNITNVNRISPDQILRFQLDDLNRYLLTTKITIVVLLAFFLCYRWAAMLNDGSYGFWLTAGVSRRSFYFQTIFKMVLLLEFAQIVGISLVMYMNRYYFDLLLILQLFISIMSGLVFLVVLAIFLSIHIRNPEFASLTFISIMGLNLGFNTSPSNLIYFFFQSDLAYNNDNAIVSSILALLVSAVLMLITLRTHARQDIDI